MLYSKDIELEDKVIESLAAGSMSINAIHSRLGKDTKVSLRAVYKAIDKLRKAGVLLKAGKRVLIDQEWAKRVEEKFNAIVPAFLLQKGERAVYSFTSIENLDAFWKTIVLPLERSVPNGEIFFYNPHNFWAYMPARKESEDAYYRHFAETNRFGFFTVGGDTAADIEFKRAYQNDRLQIDLQPIAALGRRDHITVVGPFIITVRLAKGIAERIDELYASGEGIEYLLLAISQTCERPGKVRFVLENNPARASELRRLLAKNFYFTSSEYGHGGSIPAPRSA
ncbi:hypothetical protein HYV30_02360 [Candidatus Kaiserbacteria bacterium]|nr:hypothetical protein [Candidatus Kaiserbacteria bacterium]